MSFLEPGVDWFMVDTYGVCKWLLGNTPKKKKEEILVSTCSLDSTRIRGKATLQKDYSTNMYTTENANY
jgi:hypothetical protein